MKTKVEMAESDNIHNLWKKGEKGYIDGYYYYYGPSVVVVINDRIVSAELFQVKVIQDESKTQSRFE